MLVSEDPSGSLLREFPGVIVDRPVGDPWAADSWLAIRDPSGDLRRQLEADGAFADGSSGFTEVQQLLYSVLEARATPSRSTSCRTPPTRPWLARDGRSSWLLS